ncbi:MAG: universal stress protein [Desulfococcaceae bacterium]
MALKILVAFDDSENAMRAVEHVARFFNPDSKVALFSVFQDTATLCDLHGPELTPYFHSQQSNFCTLEEKKKNQVVEAQQKAKEVLTQAGFAGEKISLKSQPKKLGIARDIVHEAENGYDIIVMGRRGLSAIKEFFLGSISQKVLSQAKDISVLMVN